MNKQKRGLALALIGALALTALAGCGAGQGESSAPAAKDAEKITFVLDWTPNTNHTGLYVAQEKGYFAAEGLDVNIVQPPEDGAEILVGSGKAQFGVSFQDFLAPALVGDNALPVEAVAAILQHNTSGIVSRKGDGITSPKGLEGKKYATWNMDLEKAILKNVVEADGGDFSKVKLIPSTVTDAPSALQSKSVDALWIYYGADGIAAEVAGVPTDYFYFKDINPIFDYYSPVVIGNAEWMKKHPDTAKAFLRALKKGYEYAIQHPDEAADILLKAVPELNKDTVHKSMAYMKDQYQADAPAWGTINLKRWNTFYQWLNENHLVDGELADNAGVNMDYLE